MGLIAVTTKNGQVKELIKWMGVGNIQSLSLFTLCSTSANLLDSH